MNIGSPSQIKLFHIMIEEIGYEWVQADCRLAFRMWPDRDPVKTAGALGCLMSNMNRKGILEERQPGSFYRIKRAPL